jgi:hypothetical protein
MRELSETQKRGEYPTSSSDETVSTAGPYENINMILMTRAVKKLSSNACMISAMVEVVRNAENADPFPKSLKMQWPILSP